MHPLASIDLDGYLHIFTEPYDDPKNHIKTDLRVTQIVVWKECLIVLNDYGVAMKIAASGSDYNSEIIAEDIIEISTGWYVQLLNTDGKVINYNPKNGDKKPVDVSEPILGIAEGVMWSDQRIYYTPIGSPIPTDYPAPDRQNETKIFDKNVLMAGDQIYLSALIVKFDGFVKVHHKSVIASDVGTIVKSTVHSNLDSVVLNDRGELYYLGHERDWDVNRMAIARDVVDYHPRIDLMIKSNGDLLYCLRVIATGMARLSGSRPYRPNWTRKRAVRDLDS